MLNNIRYLVKSAVFLFSISIFFTLFSYTYFINAASYLTQQEVNKLIQDVNNSDCPEGVKHFVNSLANKNNVSLALAGNVLVDSSGNRTQVDLSCLGPNVIESMVIRITSLTYIILGIMSAFGIGRSTTLISTSSDNAEQKQKGWQGITNSLIYIFLGIFSYFIVTFIIVGVLGLGNNGRPEQNILCQQQIVFDVTFGDGIGSCQ